MTWNRNQYNAYVAKWHVCVKRLKLFVRGECYNLRNNTGVHVSLPVGCQDTDTVVYRYPLFYEFSLK